MNTDIEVNILNHMLPEERIQNITMMKEHKCYFIY